METLKISSKNTWFTLAEDYMARHMWQKLLAEPKYLSYPSKVVETLDFSLAYNHPE